MVDAVQLLFLGSDGQLYGVAGTTVGNGGLPVQLTGGGVPAPFDLEQIRGVAAVTGGIGGLLGIGGSSASGAADDGSNPLKMGALATTNPPVLTNGQRTNVTTLLDGRVRTLSGFVQGAGADGFSNGGVAFAPTVSVVDNNGLLVVGAFSFNGANWDRTRTLAGVSSSGVGLQAAGLASVFKSTLPTYTDGQYGALQMDAAGSLRTQPQGTQFSWADGAGATLLTLGNGTAQTAAPHPLWVAPSLWNGTTIDRLTSINGATAGGTGVQAIAPAPNTVAAAAIVPSATTVAASSITLKSGAGNLYSLNLAASTAAGWFMLFDATTPPIDGAVQPKKVWPVAIGAGVDRIFDPPIRMTTGGTVVFSTTGPYTKTASATAFISGEMV